MKVTAAVLHGVRQPFELQALDLAPPKRDEVLVRLLAAGVCHSDWHLVTGDSKCAFPLVAGHEGCAEVEAVGAEVNHVKPGDRVVLCWAPHCGTCWFCTHGRKCLCPVFTKKRWAGTLMDDTTRLSLRGSPVHHFCAVACFADRAVVHQSSCIPVAATVDPAVAALVGCAVTTGVGAVLRTAEVEPGSSVAVFGVGGVGLSVVMGARIAKAERIIAIDPAVKRCELARSFGATDTISDIADPASVADRIQSLTNGRGVDYAFEAVGIPAVQEQSLGVVRPGGTVVLTGLSAMGSSTNLPGAIITRREINVLGSYYGTADPQRDFQLYLNWHKSGDLPLDRMVSKTYRLDQLNEAYADMLAGDTARGVILM